MYNEIIKSNIPNISSIVKIISGKREEATFCPLHYHDEIELLVNFEGKFTAVVDGKEYHSSAGDIIFINSRVPHSTYSDGGYDQALIQFKEEDFLEESITKIVRYSAKFQSLDDQRILIIKSDELFKTLCDVVREKAEEKESFELFIKGGIYKTLGTLYRMGVLKNYEKIWKTKETQKILPALSYINTHYSENITLKEMSDLLGFDSSYFCRLFKLSTGATFTEYLNFVRVCRAEKMLAKTDLSILEISEKVGFCSISYFNRIFKKYKSASPSYYRSAQYCRI